MRTPSQGSGGMEGPWAMRTPSQGSGGMEGPWASSTAPGAVRPCPTTSAPALATRFHVKADVNKMGIAIKANLLANNLRMWIDLLLAKDLLPPFPKDWSSPECTGCQAYRPQWCLLSYPKCIVITT